jgi:polyphenol oxidase
MHLKNFSPLSLWQFELLAKYNNDITHFVSGREGGVTPGDKGTLNLSHKVGDESSNVDENRSRIAKSISVHPECLVFPDQTHSVNVKLLKTGKENLTETDSVITNVKGICLAVMSADCVPVILYDPVTKSCAAIHSGWKGTVGKIISNTVEAMKVNFGIKTSDLIACIGPSISPDVYEVGYDVIREVEQAFGINEKLLIDVGKDGKRFLDLWEANKLQLINTGVKEKNIEISGICTYKNSDLFFSARKSKNNTGRFAAGIVLL